MVKFKQQSSVEILKGEDGPSGEWFPGKKISEIGDYYVVRYESVAGSLTEKVHKEHVRPKPPFERGKRWVVGDVAQVFDIWSWRVGKIVKVLSRGIFVIRFFGSIGLKEFHESSLRIWQFWHQNKWSVVSKGVVSKQPAKNFALKEKFGGRLARSSTFEGKGLRKKDVQSKVEKCLPVTMVANRGNICRLERSCEGLLSSSVGVPLFRQADRYSRALEKFNDQAATDKCSRLLSTEDSDQCSVASCSSNNLVNSPSCHSRNEAFADLFDSSDAESSFPPLYLEEKVEIDIHELEYNAYKSTVRALYALGPLSWEQESLLTNLRLFLHISDEEHLLQLRYLLSSQRSMIFGA